jgi:lysozyme
MKLGEQGKQLIQHYESCRLTAYEDGGGVWTIGWGNTRHEDGSRVKEGDVITQERADALFNHTALNFARQLTELLDGVYLKQNKFDALMSFAWNVGIAAFKGSTLRRKVLANTNDPSIPAEFARWDKDNEEVVQGLVYRRKSEGLLYSTGELRYFN